MTSPNLSPRTSGITFRPCSGLAELDECVRIQQAVWKFNDLETVPSDIFIVALKSGGQGVGAFDGDRQIGVTLAFFAAPDRDIYLHSHFAAVLPEYQSGGIGRLLKLAQREDALKRGINLIEWTFDPLALMNAHFNLNRLGAIIRNYIPNFYGVTSSADERLDLPSDRLSASWKIDSARVEALGKGADAPFAGKRVATIAVPTHWNVFMKSDPQRARDEQTRVREEFKRAFAERLICAGFERGEEQSRYVLFGGN